MREPIRELRVALDSLARYCVSRLTPNRVISMMRAVVVYVVRLDKILNQG